MIIGRIKSWWNCPECEGDRLGHYFPCPYSVNWTVDDLHIDALQKRIRTGGSIDLDDVGTDGPIRVGALRHGEDQGDTDAGVAASRRVG